MVEKVSKVEMIEVLRAEGWKQSFKMQRGVKRSFWKDPTGNNPSPLGIIAAYEVAHQRRRKRESATARKLRDNKPVTSSGWRPC